MTELAPQYEATSIEPPLYQDWMKRGLFTPDPNSAAKPFVIVIPPPNVTDRLHMGHGLNDTVQDVVIRFERMRGRATLWVPGTDHAGIATQNVVERLVAKEGKTRFDLGRAPFVKRVEAYVADTGSTILEQLKAIGASCDWSRTAYTLSPKMSRAVRETFVRLWEEGLIYRGHRVIHWCPRCLTSLSDEEAEHTERDGHLYHIRYPLADGSGFATVATTRPETLLGDVAVAVNPKDEDKQRFVGKMVRLPIADIEIPIIADEAVEIGFGSGFLKITPAHDANDFDTAQRHHLPMPVVMTPDARMADAALEGKAGGRVNGNLFGVDRYEARRVILEELKQLKLLDKVEPYKTAIRVCYRCDTTVEPRLSDQWFVKMAPLAKPALEAYRTGKVTFIPERRGVEYEQWMTNIRDWNISRQLWWGHRIPVWYCDACRTSTAYRDDPARCETCGGPLRQDEDVLDTWFSSWLWPFSTLGWPDRTPDLARYYPTDVMVTAPEILFFWVARMIMAGFHFMGQEPFHTVYLHGTVRDTQHRKMSKSLGNGIDPLEVVAKFGADALRFTVINGLAVGTDIILDNQDLDTAFASGRNFANKLWNVGRWLLQQRGTERQGDSGIEKAAGSFPSPNPPIPLSPALQLADRWILSRLDACIADTTAALETFRLNDAAGTPYHFLWDEFADWYLEAVKPRLFGEAGSGGESDVALAVATHCFETVLRLLHPVMPFITEELWKKLPGNADRTIVTAPWPTSTGHRDEAAEREFELLRALVSETREIRAAFEVKPSQLVKIAVVTGSGDGRWSELLGEAGPSIKWLARISDIAATKGGAGVSTVLPAGATLHVELGDATDLPRQCKRLKDEHDRLAKQLAGLKGKLANQGFLAKAPPDVVAGERAKETQWSEKVERLARQLAELGC